MITKHQLHQTLILVFFAFLGGLTRELNDLIANKVNLKNFIIGIVTAMTTGAIFGQLLIGTHISEPIACGLSGLAGFMGPYVLFILSKGLEKRLETFAEQERKELHE